MTNSQINIQNHQITIHLESKFTSKIKFFGENVMTTLLGALCFLSLFTTPLIILLTLILLMLSRVIRILPTDIIISKNHISNYFRTVHITKKSYLDYHISMNDNTVNIKLINFNFRLKDIQDLPVLTSEIANLLDLEFENQVQLTNQSEVLTYRRNTIQTVPYKSYLKIENRPDYLLISELNNTSNWFNIDLNTAIIRYSRNAFDEKQPIRETLPINNIKKIEVIINQKAGVIFRENQLRILVIEINPTPVILSSNLDMIWNSSLQHFLLKTQLKSSKHELTNLRDGEKIYAILKKLPVLKNVAIEKIILQ